MTPLRLKSGDLIAKFAEHSDVSVCFVKGGRRPFLSDGTEGYAGPKDSTTPASSQVSQGWPSLSGTLPTRDELFVATLVRSSVCQIGVLAEGSRFQAVELLIALE